MKAVSMCKRMISPTRPSLPTLTISYIRQPVMPLAITAGPDIFMMSPISLPQLHVITDRLFDHLCDAILCRRSFGRRVGDQQRPFASLPLALEFLFNPGQPIFRDSNQPELLGLQKFPNGLECFLYAVCGQDFHSPQPESVPQVSVSYTHLRAHETRHDLVC